MTTPKPSLLEFPAMLHGLVGVVRRNARSKGQVWAREYLETGTFSPPRRMREVLPGELLIVDPGADSNLVPRARWRIHLFCDAFSSESVPDEEHPRMKESFESFCQGTPWGALFDTVLPSPPWSAERTARQLAALLRFWDVLQGPRYGFRPWRDYTLEELVEDLYGMTLKGWCPEGAASMRDHLALTVERMSRATREDCMGALLRMIPLLVRADVHVKHREVLVDPVFLRERLDALSPKNWEALSSAHRYAVGAPLTAWERELERHPAR